MRSDEEEELQVENPLSFIQRAEARTQPTVEALFELHLREVLVDVLQHIGHVVPEVLVADDQLLGDHEFSEWVVGRSHTGDQVSVA